LNADFTTGSTLFNLLAHPTHQEHWVRFTKRYGPVILDFYRHMRLQESDAEDACQETLQKLVLRLPTFDPAKGRFRNWLKTVARNAALDILRKTNRLPVVGGVDDLAAMASTIEDAWAASQIERFLDYELLQEAMTRVRKRVNDKTWQAFERIALHNIPPAKAASQLGLPRPTMDTYKGRVQRMIRDEIAKLDREPEGDS
jgi:RNA polymerase sigma-70 factor (ECF subfamily)